MRAPTNASSSQDLNAIGRGHTCASTELRPISNCRHCSYGRTIALGTDSERDVSIWNHIADIYSGAHLTLPTDMARDHNDASCTLSRTCASAGTIFSPLRGSQQCRTPQSGVAPLLGIIVGSQNPSNTLRTQTLVSTSGSMMRSETARLVLSRARRLKIDNTLLVQFILKKRS